MSYAVSDYATPAKVALDCGHSIPAEFTAPTCEHPGCKYSFCDHDRVSRLPYVSHDVSRGAMCDLIRPEMEDPEGEPLFCDWLETLKAENPEVIEAVTWLTSEEDERAQTLATAAMCMTYRLLSAQLEANELNKLIEGVGTGPGGTSGIAVTSASSGTRDRQTEDPSQASAPLQPATEAVHE